MSDNKGTRIAVKMCITDTFHKCMLVDLDYILAMKYSIEEGLLYVVILDPSLRKTYRERIYAEVFKKNYRNADCLREIATYE